ncbi:MAG TPA: hypothetical protein VFE18_06865 [Phenylobacterium sp.]|jgi:hypothetical protein|uniref:hypothetical protein n=1 Tax=Phenylobacterium sp. TaxID=1871053 RepID=UPI002D332518|nr:hypothetical protein [Phenylobacterium sp.]HZZ67876.1 hypothetical protein [Phenylobacterium sp.]
MGKLFTAIVICAAIGAAAPASATAPDAPQVFLRETQQVTASAHLVFKTDDAVTAVEGNAVAVEHSQGLVVVKAAAPPPGATAQARLIALPAGPVRTITTATVSWTSAPVLPPSHSF